MDSGCNCVGAGSLRGAQKTVAAMEGCCSRFTAPEGGARLAAVAAERNTLAVEYASFVSTRLLHEDAYKIRGPLSDGFRRSVYVTRASRVPCVAYELHILTDLMAVKALEYDDVEDWRQTLEEKQVVVCTSKVFKGILEDGVLTIPQLNVVIIDSCHLIFEDQDLQYVMKCYKQCKESEQPRILALTYPLFTSGKDSETTTDSTNNKQDTNEKAANDNETGSIKGNLTECDHDIDEVDVSKSDDRRDSDNNLTGVRIIEMKDDGNEIEAVKRKEVTGTGIDDKSVAKVAKESNGEVNKDGGSNAETKESLLNSASGKTDTDIQENIHSSVNNAQTIDEAIHKTESTETKTPNDNTEQTIAVNNTGREIEVKTTPSNDNNSTADKDVNTKETNDTSVSERERDETNASKYKNKKCIKAEDLPVGVFENYDDFDMYQKLEWKIEEMEAALCCQMDLAEDIDGGKRLANTVAKPKEVLIEFSPKAPPEATPEACAELEAFMRREVAGVVAFIDEHRYDPSEIYGDELYEEFVNIPDPTIDPKLMFNQFIYVLDQLGPYAADKAAFSLLVKLEKLKIKVPYERHFLLLCLCTSVFIKIRCYADLVLSKYSDWDKIRLFSTPKVLRFAEILEQFQTPEQIAKASQNKEPSQKSDVGNDVKDEIVEKEVKIDNGNVTKDLISTENVSNTETEVDTQAIDNNMSVTYINEPINDDVTDFNDCLQIQDTNRCVNQRNTDFFESRRITEMETILNDVKTNDNNKNAKDCNAAISKNSFNTNNIGEDKELGGNTTKLTDTEEIIDKRTESGEEVEKVPKSKLVTSKTMELLDDIEKCDFVTLGNKIEDRVHTYEANLKDLDVIDDDKSEIVDKDSISTVKGLDEVDNTIVGNKDQNVDKSNASIISINDEFGVSDKAKMNDQCTLKTVDNLDSKIDTNTPKVDLKDSKMDTESNSETTDTKVDSKDEVVDLETSKTDAKCKKEDDSKIDTQSEEVNIATAKTNLEATDPKSKEVDTTSNIEAKTDSKTPGTDPKVKTKDPPDPKGRGIGKGGARRHHRVGGRRGGGHAARLQLLQQHADALCGVVFLRDPLLANIMFMLVADMSRSRPSLSHLCAQYCAVESEGDECRPQKKHEDVLKKFRMHECNLLLATPALEEGIDLPRCNLVVRWDVPPSYRSHGLCRSRARAPRSVLALMAESSTASETLLDHLSVYRELDQIISRKCGCGIQNEPPAAEEVHADIFTPVIKPYTPIEDKDTAKDKKDIDGAKEIDKKEVNKDIEAAIRKVDDMKNIEKEFSDERRKPSEIDIKSGEELIIYKDGIISIDGAKTADTNGIAANKDASKAVNNKMNELANDSTFHDVKVESNSVTNNDAEINELAKDSTVNDDRKNDSHNDKVDRVIIKECVDGITKEVLRTEVIVTSSEKTKSVKNDKIEVKSALNDNSIPVEEDSVGSVNKEFNVKYSFCGKCVRENSCKCNVSVNGEDRPSEVRCRDEKCEGGVCSVDLSSAIALINRYCGKLPSDTFTRLAPQYWTEAVALPDRRTGGARAAYVCTLRLPLNCPVKYNIVGHPMPTRVLARRMVALQACRILHKSGELDNHLMPIGKENFKAAELESTAHSDSENNDSARPGTTKRRQYYYKRTASAFTDCQPLIDSTDAEIEQQTWDEAKESYNARFPPDTKRNRLFALSSRLWCALPERYNTRGRRLHAPQHAPHAQAVLMATAHPHALQIPAFPVYTRSGEVRVSIEPAHRADVRISPRRARLVRRFMRFVFSDVLRVRRRGMRLQTEGSTHNNYYIVPTVRVPHEDGTSHVDIDWAFLELIYRHTEEKKNSVEKPVLLHQDDEEDEEEVVEKKPKREREKDGKVKKMENPFLKPGEVFVFDAEKYRDAVVTPWYRNQDQPQYFLVAEICWNLSPDSAFPSVSHGSFRDYYGAKYGVTLTQAHQPLLDVDHTSARLNLLTPRYVNRKGVALPVSSERTRRAKRDRLDQKQILVPELCTVHPFAAPLWFATVALPCVLYRINALLIADEIRRAVSADVALGAPATRGAPPPHWPPLDFGWSLAEVLNTDEKGDKSERKKEEDDTKKEIKHSEETEDTKEESTGGETQETAGVQEKTINDILQEKEDAESGFEIGTWSNDMASSIPQAEREYDERMEPLPPNLTFCTSASGGANWSEPIQKPKTSFGASKAFSMAESDCSYLSSDFDTDDSDLNSDGSEEDLDSGGFGSKNYASMGVRIEYKTAHEAEAVDLERKVKASSAPHCDRADDALDLAVQRRVLKRAAPPQQYIEKYNKSVNGHKEEIKTHHLVAKNDPIKEILPDTAKEMETLRKELHKQLKRKGIHEITQEVLATGTMRDEDAVRIDKETTRKEDLGYDVIHNQIEGIKCSENDVELNDIDSVDKEQNCKGNKKVTTDLIVKESDKGIIKDGNTRVISTELSKKSVDSRNEQVNVSEEERNVTLIVKSGTFNEAVKTKEFKIGTAENEIDRITNDNNVNLNANITTDIEEAVNITDKTKENNIGTILKDNDIIENNPDSALAKNNIHLGLNTTEIVKGYDFDVNSRTIDKIANSDQSKITEKSTNSEKSKVTVKSDPSNKTKESIKSDQSKVTNKSTNTGRSEVTDESINADKSKVTDKSTKSDQSQVTDSMDSDQFKTDLLHEIFPHGDALELQNGQVTIESIERNKREIMKQFKASLTREELEKYSCFSMLDVDVDSPDYVNEKVANVGFDTKESYMEKVNGFRSTKEHTPYYQDGKGQGAEFDFDYQPDLEGHPGPSPSVILQALTMSNANDGINLERLETIGDSFLKFAITAYLYCAHPAVHEGKLSHMRSKQVSNLNLYRLGRNKRLGARMIASKFEPHDNWLPPCHRPPPTHHPASGEQESQMQKEAATDNTGCFIPYNLITQHSIPDKSIADCVEALIGAYLLECGPRGALLFMAWLGIAVLPRHALPLPADHPAAALARARAPAKPPAPPSPKQSYSSSSISYSSDSSRQSSDDELEPEESQTAAECDGSWQGRPVGSLRPRRDENGQWVQIVFGELRAPPSPLLRYVEDPEGELERMLSGYDALERTLQYRFRDRSLLLQALTHASHQQNRLTDCYQRLEFLGDAILDYLITRHLYEDARRHSPGALTDLRSALVNNTIFATLAARHGFHKYFRHMSPGLNEVLTKYVKIQEENGHSISEEHYLIQEDEMEQAEDVEVPKALGDLFESVAGAIFLDSGMSLSAVWKSYVRLMGAELEAFSAAAPKSPVRELLEAEPDTAKFGKPERLADGRRVRVCVEVFGRGAFKGIGRNYRIAKGTAARCALRHLRATRDPRR